MLDFVKDLLKFSGRLNRKAYWSLILKLLAFMIVGIAIGIALMTASAPFFGGALVFASVIIALIASLGVSVRRLHDRNKSAWWLIPFNFLPNGLVNMSETTPDSSTSVTVLTVGIALSIWAFVDMGCLKGTEGDNAYGPDPLQNQNQ